jgi:hypothetical protein
MIPFLELQARVQALLRDSVFFSTWKPEEILIEDKSSITVRLAKALGDATGIVIVITTAKGDTPVVNRGRVVLQETLTIAISRSFIYEGPSLLDAVDAAIRCVHGAWTATDERTMRDPQNQFRLVNHEPIAPPDGVDADIHHVTFTAPVSFRFEDPA